MLMNDHPSPAQPFPPAHFHKQDEALRKRIEENVAASERERRIRAEAAAKENVVSMSMMSDEPPGTVSLASLHKENARIAADSHASASNRLAEAARKVNPDTPKGTGGLKAAQGIFGGQMGGLV